jgi:hypothetical protein
MDRQSLQSWCDLFATAWRENDRDLIGSLVPDTFLWRTGPFSEVFRDRAPLVEHWVAVVQAEEDHAISYEILATCDDLGIVRFRATFVRHANQRVTEDVLLAIRLDADGRCREFREWCKSDLSWIAK